MSAVRVDALTTMARAATELELRNADQLAFELGQAKRAVDEVLVEAKWVVENPSERNLADLRAALARIGGDA